MSPTQLPDVVEAHEQLEGGGFLVHRPFPSMALPDMDPFLLLDQMGPTETAPGEAKGAPDHPHRGFETVTYMLAGAMEHRDSHGHHGVLGPGDVQWMTAGSGVVHSEMPTGPTMEEGGVMHGVQLWVNLPAKQKMMAPRYQDIPAERIPNVPIEGGTVRVLSGQFQDTHAAIDTVVPIRYLHATLDAGTTLDDDAPAGHNAFVYVLAGTAEVAGHRVGPHHLVRVAGTYRIKAETSVDALMLSGPPLGEPVARYGPFVMNTRDELQQALRDFQAGAFGTIAPEVSEGAP